ncbi:apical junction molecule-like isoform X1 [Emydura macquarii macquarii]|uniref:apical junction molecule-like isoform X1 n=2 Tax=Emydura macquarii macquarii TaxID=1129001 RepID=UPI00352B6CA4
MKKCRFGFSSPCQMAITFHNQRAMDRARMDHAAFLREKDSLSQRRIDCLRVTPSIVGKQFVKQRNFLLERCQEEMMEQEKETLVAELEAELSQEAETFLETYGRRYQSHTINQRAMDRARRDHAAFLSKKDTLSQERIDCLRVAPSTMAEQCAEQRRLLLERCQEEMMEPEKETLLAELEAQLSREAEPFLETYGRRYQHHTINQRAMDRACTDHAAFLREKDGLSQCRIDCLRVTPNVVGEQFVKQRMFLLERCREEMKEPEKETLVAELEAELTQEAETFLETYGRRYQCHAINQRAMHRARTDHTAFLREKDALSKCRIECRRVAPRAVVKQFVEQCRLLLERCREKMKGPEKETLLAELMAELTQEAETFLKTYGRRYQSHAINQRAMDRARTDHAAFVGKKDVLSHHMIECLKVTPSEMEEQFRELHKSLLKRCRMEMMEPEETLLLELMAELSQEAETFLETYGVRYQSHYNRQMTAYDSSLRDHGGSQKNGFTNPILVVVVGAVVLAALVLLP